ncbi:MAG: UDP-2,3-diacylglucosamine diphosphatase LpxI [Pseudomonadota bacterium]
MDARAGREALAPSQAAGGTEPQLASQVVGRASVVREGREASQGPGHRVAGPLGILAGGGSLPTAVAREVTARGEDVHIVGLRGEADQAIEAYSHDWVYWGAIGALLRAFRSAGVRRLAIVGSVTRPDLAHIRPDLGFFTHLPALLKLMRGGDDSVLSRVVRFFERRGFDVVGVHDVAPTLVVGEAALVEGAITATHQRDMTLGAQLLDRLGPFDIGQAAVVREGRVLGIEAAEGTDRLLERVAVLDGRALTPPTTPPEAEADGAAHAWPNGVLIKRPKPGQELRVDMPAIGPRTIEGCARAALAGLALRSGQVLIAEREETVARATASGLFILGRADGGEQSDEDGAGTAAPTPNGASDAGRAAQPTRKVRAHDEARIDHITVVRAATPQRAHPDVELALGRYRAPAPAKIRSDVVKAAQITRALQPFTTGQAVIVAQHYVLAVQAGEDLLALIERAATLRQWGRRQARRRLGVLFIARFDAPFRRQRAAGEEVAAWCALIQSTADARLAGIAMGEQALAMGHDQPSVVKAAAAVRLHLIVHRTEPRRAST